MSNFLLFALTAALATATLVAQQADATLGSLVGVVVDDQTGRAISGARVSPSPGNPRELGVMTDAAGRFELTNVRPGRFAIRASHPDYADGAWGRRTQPSGMFQFFDLQPGERAEGLVIRMQRLATLSGRVIDAGGASLAGAVVHLMRLRGGGDEVRSVDVVHTTETMGLGRFGRNVIAGRYLVAVASPTIPDAKLRASGTWPTQYSGGGHTPTRADIVTLQPDDRRDVVLRLSDSTFHTTIRGRVVGTVPPGLALGLFAESPTFDTGLPILNAVVQRDGTFTMASVPRGRYRLQTVHFPPAPMNVRMMGVGFSWSGRDRLAVRPPIEPTIIADMPIVVGGEPLDDVQVPLQTGARISGRIEFEGPVPAPDSGVLATVPVIPLVTDRRPYPVVPVASIDADNRFRTAGLPPGRYVLGFLNLFQHGEWQPRVTPVVELGTDDADVSIVLTNRRSFVRGVIRDATGAPRPDATVHVFPVDRALWHASPWEAVGVLSIIPDRYGQYEIPDLKPRDYHLIATTTVADPDAPIDTFFASLVPRASRLTIAEGETILRDLMLR